jgi:hypothetical protein
MKIFKLNKSEISGGFRCRLYGLDGNEIQEIELKNLDGIDFQRSGKVEDDDYFMQNNIAEFIVDGDNFYIYENGYKYDAGDWFFNCHLDGDLSYDAIRIKRFI